MSKERKEKGMKSKRVKGILKGVATAGVVLGASNAVDAGVVYAAEDDNGVEYDTEVKEAVDESSDIEVIEDTKEEGLNAAVSEVIDEAKDATLENGMDSAAGSLENIGGDIAAVDNASASVDEANAIYEASASNANSVVADVKTAVDDANTSASTEVVETTSQKADKVEALANDTYSNQAKADEAKNNASVIADEAEVIAKKAEDDVKTAEEKVQAAEKALEIAKENKAVADKAADEAAEKLKEVLESNGFIDADGNVVSSMISVDENGEYSVSDALDGDAKDAINAVFNAYNKAKEEATNAAEEELSSKNEYDDLYSKYIESERAVGIQVKDRNAAYQAMNEAKDVLDNAKNDYDLKEAEHNRLQEIRDDLKKTVDDNNKIREQHKKDEEALEAAQKAVGIQVKDRNAAKEEYEAALNDTTTADALSDINDKVSGLEDDKTKADDAVNKAKDFQVNEAAKAIVDLQEEIDAGNGEEWRKCDKLFDAIIKGYYVPEVLNLAEGDTVTYYNDGKFVLFDDDSLNYYKLTINHADGTSEDLFLNYKLDETGKRLIIFEKTETEVVVKEGVAEKYVSVDDSNVELSVDEFNTGLDNGDVIKVDNTYYYKNSDGTVTVDKALSDNQSVSAEEETKELVDGKWVATKKGAVTTTTSNDLTLYGRAVYDSEDEAKAAAQSMISATNSEEVEISDVNINVITDTTTTTETTYDASADVSFVTKLTTVIDVTGVQKDYGLYSGLEDDVKDIVKELEKAGYKVISQSVSEVKVEKIKDRIIANDTYEYKSGKITIEYVAVDSKTVNYSTWDNITDLFAGDKKQKAIIEETYKKDGTEILDFTGWNGNFTTADVKVVGRDTVSGTATGADTKATAEFDAKSAAIEAANTKASSKAASAESKVTGIVKSVVKNASVSTTGTAVYSTKVSSLTTENIKASDVKTEEVKTENTITKYGYEASFTKTSQSVEEDVVLNVTEYFVVELECQDEVAAETKIEYTNDKYDAGEYILVEETDEGLNTFLDGYRKPKATLVEALNTQEKIAEALKTAKVSQESAASANEEHEAEVAKLKEAYDAQEEEHNRLQEIRDNLKKVVENNELAEEKFKEDDKALEAAQANVGKQVKERNEAKKKYDAAKSDYDEKKADYDAKEAEHKKLQEIRDELKKQYEAAQTNYNQNKKIADKAVENLENIEDIRGTVVNAVNALSTLKANGTSEESISQLGIDLENAKKNLDTAKNNAKSARDNADRAKNAVNNDSGYKVKSSGGSTNTQPAKPTTPDAPSVTPNNPTGTQETPTGTQETPAVVPDGPVAPVTPVVPVAVAPVVPAVPAAPTPVVQIQPVNVPVVQNGNNANNQNANNQNANNATNGNDRRRGVEDLVDRNKNDNENGKELSEITDQEVPLGVLEEDNVVDLEDVKTPLVASVNEKKSIWWWWLLIVAAVTGTTGKTVYDKKHKKGLFAEKKEDKENKK